MSTNKKEIPPDFRCLPPREASTQRDKQTLVRGNVLLNSLVGRRIYCGTLECLLSIDKSYNSTLYLGAKQRRREMTVIIHGVWLTGAFRSLGEEQTQRCRPAPSQTTSKRCLIRVQLDNLMIVRCHGLHTHKSTLCVLVLDVSVCIFFCRTPGASKDDLCSAGK